MFVRQRSRTRSHEVEGERGGFAEGKETDENDARAEVPRVLVCQIVLLYLTATSALFSCIDLLQEQSVVRLSFTFFLLDVCHAVRTS